MIKMKVSGPILAVVRVVRHNHSTLASPRAPRVPSVAGESRKILGKGKVAAGIAYIIFLPEVNDQLFYYIFIDVAFSTVFLFKNF